MGAARGKQWVYSSPLLALSWEQRRAVASVKVIAKASRDCRVRPQEGKNQ